MTLQPDTATTHVIYDRASASILCRELGIRTLSELPPNCVCVRWEYVAQCKLQVSIFDQDTGLAFGANIRGGQAIRYEILVELPRDVTHAQSPSCQDVRRVIENQ